MQGDSAASQIMRVLSTATPMNVFTYLTFVAKLVLMLSLLFWVLTIFTFIRRRKGGYSKSLIFYGWLALSCSVFGAAYSGLNSYIGLVGGSNPYKTSDVMAATIAVFYVLLPGVIGWLIAAFGNAGARRA